MRVRLRDRLWEIQDVRGAGTESLLDLRRVDDRAGPLRLTVAAGLEPSLQPEPTTKLRFELGNPVLLGELHTALALTMAHGRGDLLAVEHGRIDVEPYQLVPVLAAMRQPKARLLVADDVGLGKTIEAGLILLELARRGRADRVLIACPAGLQDQWVEEMRFRFNLDFTKVDNRAWLDLRRNYPTTVSPWTAVPLAVSSIDYLKANLPAIKAAPPFDVVLIDEAHHVTRAFAGEGRSSATDRSRLARTLADHCRELVLLSATPHNGYKESFASLLQLLSPHLAADDGRLDPEMVRPFVVRRLKDEVARGNPPKPISRRHSPVPIEVTPSSREKEIHQRLRGHSKRMLHALRETDSYHVEAFALEVLRKRALSSPQALRESLRRRAANLGVGAVERMSRQRTDTLAQYRGDTALTEHDLDDAEELALSGVAAHLPDVDLRDEQRLVGALLDLVEAMRPSDDSKLTRLRTWLDGFKAERNGERLIVFTEYRDTLNYLEANLGTGPTMRIDGTLPLKARREVLQTFAQTPGAILLATDAAGEGLNLQHACHVVVHYELPWNPNRLEQRNGRVDRYGQDNVVEISYMYLKDTRDEEILQRLREKLAEITRQLGSSSDVLGVGGRGEVVDGLLEDLPIGEIEVRLERAAQQVRDYLSNSGALAVLRSLPDESRAETAKAADAWSRGAWALPDFDEYADLVRSVVMHESGRVEPAGNDLVRITPGPMLGQYPGVGSQPFTATFSRAAALDAANSGVAFLTPIHPLVRAVLQRVRSRLYDSHSKDRVAVRLMNGQVDGWLFTAVGRLLADDNRLLEEPLLAVFVPRTGSGAPGQPSRDDEADGRLLRARPTGSSSAEIGSLARQRLADGFDQAMELAMAEAARRLAERAWNIRDQLAEDAKRMAADLDRWRLAELAELERRFATGTGQAVQMSFFEDLGHGGLTSLDDAQKLVEEEFDRRRDGLRRGFAVADPAAPDPVGCLLLVGA